MTTLERNAVLPPVGAWRRERSGLAILTLPCMIYSMDLTVLNLASPQLAAHLHPTSSELLWIIDIYGFVIAGSLLTMGTLGDRIGRRRLLMIGAVAFGCASLLAAFSDSAIMLIVARALQGLAAATLAPSTLSLLRNMFTDPRERALAISVWSGSFAVGAAAGPIIGGVLLAHFWWGSVFLINLPVMALVLLLAPSLLPEFRTRTVSRLDVFSAALSIVAMIAVIFAIKRYAEYGDVLASGSAVLIGLSAGIAFIVRQRKAMEPFIDLALFRSWPFTTAFLASVAAFFVNFGTFYLIAQYLQLVAGMNPIEAGLWTTPPAIAFVAVSALAPSLVSRVSPTCVFAGGFTVAAAGLLLVGLIGTNFGAPFVVAGGVILAVGLGPIFIVTAQQIVDAAPLAQAGAASGLSEASTELGGALGIAVFGSLAAARYRQDLSEVDTAGLPANVVDALTQTLGGVIEAASSMPATFSIPLIAHAREAFVAGMQASMLIASGVAAAACAAVIASRRSSIPAGFKRAGGAHDTE